MPLQKTIIWISRVTQPCGALSTKPACVHATVLGLSALSTIASLPLRGAAVINDLHWKVSKRKGADGGGQSTSTSATTTIVTDQFGCHFKPKVLDGHLGAFACVVLHQDESIRDGYIK